MKVYCGLDNGVSGSCGIITSEGEVKYLHTPVKKERSYTKEEKYITRIDVIKLFNIFEPYLKEEVYVMMERPLINPKFWTATLSAIRALEATIVVLEKCNYKYSYLPSTEWQNELLPEYYGGVLVEKENLKSTSLAIGKQLFSQVDFTGFKDSDGLLIGEYCRRKYQNEVKL